MLKLLLINLTIYFLLILSLNMFLCSKLSLNPPLLPHMNSGLIYSTIGVSTPFTICDANVDLESDYLLNSEPFSSFIFSYHGGVSSSACIDYNGRRLIFKIESIYQVYDLTQREWCGSFAIIETPIDSLHPEISNGISCHCPAGVNDYKFGPCPLDTIDESNLTFYESLPSSSYISKMDLCHNIVVRATAEGCLFDSDSSTDYSLKFKTVWSMHPIFRMKTRPILEVNIGVYSDNPITCSEPPCQLTNFNVSTLTDQEIEFNLNVPYKLHISYLSITPLSDVIEDYVISSATGNFTGIDDIFLIDSGYFNKDSELDSLKLCPIRKIENFKVQYNKWELDNSLKEVFSAKKCHPAEGNIQSPFQRLESYQIEANKLSQRINPELIDFMPQGQSVIKIRTEASVSISVKINPPANTPVNVIKDEGAVTSFSVTCATGYDDEGYPCKSDISVSSKTQIQIQALDVQQTILTADMEQGLNSFNFFLKHSFTTKSTVSLCAITDINRKCSTIKLVDKYDDPIKEPEVNGTEDDSNNSGSGNIFTNKDGKLETWLIIVIVIASIVAFIIFLPIFIPLTKFIFLLIRKCGKSLQSKANHLNNKVNENSKFGLQDV